MHSNRQKDQARIDKYLCYSGLVNVLVVQTAFLGDVILTTPFLERLKQELPSSTIHIVTTPSGCEVLADIPRVVCHVLDKQQGIWSGLQQLQRELESISFDFVFCVHRSIRSLIIARRVVAFKRIAFSSLAAWLLGFEVFPYSKYNEATHYSEKPQALLQTIGAEVKKMPPVLYVSQADQEWAKKTLPDSAIVVSPFSVWGTKMWFSDRFARVACRLAKETSKSVVLVGSKGSRELVVAQTITEKLAAEQIKCVNLVGKTSIGQLKAVIKQAALLVANDSAPVHIASAFDVPTVAIFGPTVKKWGFFPLSSKSRMVECKNVPCRPCSLHGPKTCPKKHFRCMDKITVEDVVQAANEVLG